MHRFNAFIEGVFIFYSLIAFPYFRQIEWQIEKRFLIKESPKPD